METSFTQYEQCMLVFIFDDSVCMVSTSDNAQEIANTRETFLLHVYDSRTMKCFCFCSISCLHPMQKYVVRRGRTVSSTPISFRFHRQ